jgi:hypothetical protein
MHFLLATLFFLQAAPTTTEPAKSTVSPKELEAMMQQRSTMLIDPKQRANDYKQAFEMLSQEKSIGKVYFHLSDGTKLSNIIDMKILPGNTLVIFRFSTPQGIRLHVVEIEDIQGITHQ